MFALSDSDLDRKTIGAGDRSLGGRVDPRYAFQRRKKPTGRSLSAQIAGATQAIDCSWVCKACPGNVRYKFARIDLHGKAWDAFTRISSASKTARGPHRGGDRGGILTLDCRAGETHPFNGAVSCIWTCRHGTEPPGDTAEWRPIGERHGRLPRPISKMAISTAQKRGVLSARQDTTKTGDRRG